MSLTKSDLKEIQAIFEYVFDRKFDEKMEEHQLVTKEDISHLHSKHEFYNKMDELMGEVSDEHEENLIQQATQEDHEIRITSTEQKLVLTPA